MRAINANGEYFISGDGTAGRVLRNIQLQIDGTNTDTTKCTVTSLWNGDTIAATDHIAKGETTGNFKLDAGGNTLTIQATGFTGNVVAVLSSSVHCNRTGNEIVALWARPSNNGIEVILISDSSATELDLTSITSGYIQVRMTYITDA